MNYNKGPLIYEGKAKKIFAVEGHKNLVWQDFKDSLTAFNAQKKEELDGKGDVNFKITSSIFKFLEKRYQIPTHSVEFGADRNWVTKRLEMIPLEVVVRNRLAGSTAKKFNIEVGTWLDQPLVEFYYKDDALNDPFVSDEQALFLKAARDQQELQELKALAFKVNSALIDFFDPLSIDLVDFKLEFGRDINGELCLGDEISPDSCRLWDKETGQSMDKDRFRKSLGNVLENYQEVLHRIEKHWSVL